MNLPLVCTVLGFVRGRPLNPNQLIHVCEVGVGRIKGIWRVEDPLPFHQKSPDRNNDTAVVVGDDYNAKKDGSPSSGVTKRTLLAMALTELQESLDMEAEPDPLQGEQTWPSKEEVGCKASRLGFLLCYFYCFLEKICIFTYFPPMPMMYSIFLTGLPDIYYGYPSLLINIVRRSSSSSRSRSFF